jgi:hypothetical protein
VASRNDPIGDHYHRQRFDLRQRFFLSRAVGHHSRQIDRLSDPTAVGFSIELDVKASSN